ncbi:MULTISPECIES: ROK family protein [Virgibacillus]|uniref:fructokinase n=2 Tax=Virgibacillus TaxID=84406 RepID=A0A024Q8F9_9BACI|nr:MULTISPECIES: ROK family protein [Virgibacillus]EQB37645.1 hypothetical protein M948_03580 [Virgibacillus sp. CM-4]MYL40385.1 ROK family protein [Virgibacillus massiliensis]GGJ59441.1 putative fructokinase [Virgibacillus kapii]CDQ38828.1 Putative fructokinase [Virgibacillus massiliensis]
MLTGGIEAGGTKFVCAVGKGSGEIIDKVTFPTTTPDETLRRVRDYFSEFSIRAIGIGSFGPVDLDKKSTSYGTILHTPKQQWRQFDLLTAMKEYVQVPLFLDTDVNAAALGEYKYGVAQKDQSCLYITVGTGIGAGFVKDGVTYQGKSHPEMGHIMIQKHTDDYFAGICPSHGACLEGLASGPAIEKRYGKKAELLASHKEVWELEAFYLAQAIINYTLVLSPERVIIGGGVMKQHELYQRIRNYFSQLMNNYVELGNLEDFITAPTLSDEQGIKGAIALTYME